MLSGAGVSESVRDLRGGKHFGATTRYDALRLSEAGVRECLRSLLSLRSAKLSHGSVSGFPKRELADPYRTAEPLHNAAARLAFGIRPGS